MSHHHVVIIGSGPAGLTSAIYTARANLGPLVIEGEPSSTSDQPGGQLMLTTEVENFPGWPEGIMGPELMSRCREQASRFGAQFLTEKVTAIDFSERPFKMWVRDTLYTADSVIVSTGAQSLMLGLEAEQRLLGHGLSTCATCDGFFFRGHDIAVVGGTLGKVFPNTRTQLPRFDEQKLDIGVTRRQIEGDLLMKWYPEIEARLEKLASETQSVHGNIGAFVEDKGSGTIMLQQAQRMGMKKIHPIDSKLQ